MPRLPTVSYEDYEEPSSSAVATNQTPPRSTRQHTKAAAPAMTPEALRNSPAAPARLPPTAESNPNDESESSMGLSKVQRAEEYPQLAFRPRRELCHNGVDGVGGAAAAAPERGKGPSSRPREFVFGLGSHGLHDQSAMWQTFRDGDAENMKSTSGAHADHTTQRAKGKSKKSKKSKAASSPRGSPQTQPPSSVPRLPPIAAQGTGRSFSTESSHPNAPRALRCGGVFDTFSYFSVHRVHPELYAS